MATRRRRVGTVEFIWCALQLGFEIAVDALCGWWLY